MLPVRALFVDFDGTACVRDVSEMLLDTFGEPGWERFDEAVDRGEMGLREAGAHQVEMLRGSREEMLVFALPRAQLTPSFPTFVAWAEERDLPLVLASDGFAFYIRPILEEAGLGHLEVVTNPLVFEGPAPFQLHPNGHPCASAAGRARCSPRKACVSATARSRSSAMVNPTATEPCTRTSSSRRMRSSRSASSTECRSIGGRRSTTCAKASKPSRPSRDPSEANAVRAGDLRERAAS